MFSEKSHSTGDDHPPVRLPDKRADPRETSASHRKRKFHRKTGVTALAAPNLEQLQRAAGSRFNWALTTSVLATSVKKQASSVLFQFARRKRSQIENPIIDVTKCSTPPAESPNYMSASMEEVGHPDSACRSLSVGTYDQNSVCLGQTFSGTTYSPSLESSSGLCSPHSENEYTPVNRKGRRHYSGGSEGKPCLASEPGTDDSSNTPRSKRFSCSHVKFSDELNTVDSLGDDRLTGRSCTCPVLPETGAEVDSSGDAGG
ncbi:unnamed protein product [Echinostoma caproni]|uniref:TIAM Rac1 associated GEF 2a n=1 Tax=Echinostoma caproni TaxID=27848 RepID=A0A183ATY6_9TREM|nr:unnamed protein product [Echinostoma caproni]